MFGIQKSYGTRVRHDIRIIATGHRDSNDDSPAKMKSITSLCILAVVSYGVMCTDGGSGEWTDRAEGAAITNCLERGGVDFAGSAGEMQFFADASSEDEVSNPGLGFDRKSGLVVNVWLPPSRAGAPLEWMVWVAQDVSEEELSPLSAIEHSNAYVAFVTVPSPGQRKALEGCIEFGGQEEADGADGPRFDPTAEGTVAE